MAYKQICWPMCFPKCGLPGPKIYLATGATNGQAACRWRGPDAREDQIDGGQGPSGGQRDVWSLLRAQ
jgi:hypothetical protein